MAQSKFEQYLDILNNKQPRKVTSGQPTSATATSAGLNSLQHDEEPSPLRTKHYLKTTLGGESPGHRSSQLPDAMDEADADEEESKGEPKNKVIIDFSQAELPFSNFQSLQERDRDRYRRDAMTTA